MSDLYWLNTTYACGGIVIKEDLIIDSCPIYQWMRGHTLGYVLQYLRREKRLIDCVKVTDQETRGLSA